MTYNLDRSNLRQILLDSPKQLARGIELAGSISWPNTIENVVISGMGGSALPGEILRLYLAEIASPLRVYLNRNYTLPAESFGHSLNILASYSGNTEETISCFQEALDKKLTGIGSTSGGHLAELCRQNNWPSAIIPPGLPPRYALGYFLGAFLGILRNSGALELDQKAIERTDEFLTSQMPELEKLGQSIAEQMKGKTPVIYVQEKLEALAKIIKIKLNENAKTPAFFNVYPELNHNEMLGYTLPRGPFFILNLLDPDDNPKNVSRIQKTKQVLSERGIPVVDYTILGQNILEKTLSTIILGDWASYYLALAYGQDPTPTVMVEEFKKLLV